MIFIFVTGFFLFPKSKSKKIFLAIFLVITNLLGGLVFGYALGTIGGGLSSAISAFFPSSTNSTISNNTNETFTSFRMAIQTTQKPHSMFNTVMEPSLLSTNNNNFDQNLNCILSTFQDFSKMENCFHITTAARKFVEYEKFSTLQRIELMEVTAGTETMNGTSPPTSSSSFDLGTTIIQGLYSAAIFIGGFFGCLFAMASGPMFGRKISILLCCLISVIGSVGSSASYSWASLIVFRCILGFGAGIATAVCSVYCAELMPYAKYQGVLGAMFNMGISLGTTFGYVFGAIFVRSSEQWRAVHAFDNLFTIPLFLIVLFIIPESPMFIYGGSHGHAPTAATVATVADAVGEMSITTTSVVSVDDQELKDSVITTTTTNTTNTTTAAILNESGTIVDKVPEKQKTMSTIAALKRLFCSKAIRGTILAFFGCFALEWTGILSATMFLPSLIEGAGLSDPLDQQLASFGVAIWQIFCIVPAIFLIDKFGRKPIIIFGFTVSLVMDLATGFIFQFGEDGSDYKIILSIIFICLYLIGFHCGIGSLGYILAHEVFNGENEKVIVFGTSMATLIMWSTTIVLSLFFIPVVTLTNQAVPWFIFSGISFIGLLLYIFVLQETSPTVLAKRALKESSLKNPKPESETISSATSSDEINKAQVA